MRVTKIVKKGKKDVIIHFDSDEKLFLTVDVFLKSGLKKNEVISDDRFSFLVKENRLFHIKQRAFRYLGRRLHSTSELRTKLLQKGYEKNLIDEVIDELKVRNYLDDAEFAKMFVEEKVKLKLWGEKKLKNELIKRGIKSEIISEVLNSHISQDNTFNNAMTIAAKKYETLKNRNLEPDAIKRKLVTFLSSRGYNYDDIKIVCEKLISENDSYD